MTVLNLMKLYLNCLNEILNRVVVCYYNLELYKNLVSNLLMKKSVPDLFLLAVTALILTKLLKFMFLLTIWVGLLGITEIFRKKIPELLLFI